MKKCQARIFALEGGVLSYHQFQQPEGVQKKKEVDIATIREYIHY